MTTHSNHHDRPINELDMPSQFAVFAAEIAVTRLEALAAEAAEAATRCDQ